MKDFHSQEQRAMLSANGHRRQRVFGEQPAKPTTYYGRPMLKKPTWRWFIPLYFFFGGLAGRAIAPPCAMLVTSR